MSKLPFISNIQRFSLDDGPGIRTTVFFMGCNLRCLWCHNPECISPSPSLQVLERTCTNCRKCADVCPHGVHVFANGKHDVVRENCTACGACAYACPTQSLEIIGKQYEPAQLLRELKKDEPYYEKSQGGVTFSGGEPMLNLDYLLDILPLAKQEGYHTAIDTAGLVPFSHFEAVMPYVDVFLFDIKLFDAAKHKAATGVDNARIQENLRRLSESGANIIVRVPVIMEINGDLGELERIAAFIAALPRQPQLVELLPYHSYGTGKYTTLGLVNEIKDHTPPTEAFMQQALQLFLDKGINATI